VVGGSSGMGFAVAEALLAAGARVTIAGRSAERLEAAAARLDGVRSFAADVTREADVERLFAETGELDHLVVTAADIAGAYRLISELDVAAARGLVDSKLIAALLLAKHGAPLLAEGGSITFTSGIAAYRPAPKGVMAAAVNAALAGLARALAVELAPLRVNVVSPGWVDTPIWDTLAGAGKAETLAAMAARLPAGRVGRPEDVAQAVLALVGNTFITGTVLHVDGGHRLV
jgi:NAD(P)-dependent dehydrogenase (short-subunit alcohol dehydrogenase family)